MQERGCEPGFHEILGYSPFPAPPQTEEFFVETYKVLGGFHMKSAGFQKYELLRDDQVYGLSFERPNDCMSCRHFMAQFCWGCLWCFRFAMVVVISWPNFVGVVYGASDLRWLTAVMEYV